jgi:hypothetical protein
MPNTRVKQTPAERARRGKYKTEIGRLSPTHAQVDGMQAADVARRRTVEEFHRGPPVSSILTDLVHVLNNKPNDPLRWSRDALSCAATRVPKVTVANQSFPKAGFSRAGRVEPLVIGADETSPSR